MMGVSYKRLFKLMIDREMKKQDLLRLMIFANHFETAPS